MSDRQAEEDFIAGMRESGKMDRILDAMKATAPADPPADEVDTGEAADDEAPGDELDTADETVDDSADDDVVDANAADDDDEADDDAADEDEGLFLDLTPEVEELLAKYGGDVNKALAALASSQSTIGRQGNELGEVRAELEALRQQLQTGAFEPYAWPDFEEVEPAEAVNDLYRVAEQAFARGDQDAFGTALQYMDQLDPIRARLYAQTKAGEIQAQQAAQTAPVVTLESLVSDLAATAPDLRTPEVQQAIAAEAQKFPSLARLLSDTNADPQERANVLKEMYDRVSSRQTADTVTKSARRVALRTSEEARDARRSARVATGDRSGAKTVPDEDQPDTRIALRSSHGGDFNVTEVHRQAQELAGGLPEMVMRNGRMYVRAEDGSLVPRAE